jgi:FkbM family methyltransferase
MANTIFLKEVNLFKKLIFIIPYYTLHRNILFGYLFKKLIKKFTYIFLKKKLIFYIPGNLETAFYSSFLTKTYEINDYFIIKKNLKPNYKPIIIGGGIGFIATIVSKIVKKKISIFEIDTNIIPYLIKNLFKNQVDFSIYQTLFFLNTKPKIFSFNKSINFISTSLYNKTNKIYTNATKLNKPISYNELCKQNNIVYDTLIIDAEGYEYDILTDISKESDIKHIFFELHASILKKKKTIFLLNYLKKMKFTQIDKFFNSYYFSKIKN